MASVTVVYLSIRVCVCLCVCAQFGLPGDLDIPISTYFNL